MGEFGTPMVEEGEVLGVSNGTIRRSDNTFL